MSISLGPSGYRFEGNGHRYDYSVIDRAAGTIDLSVDGSKMQRTNIRDEPPDFEKWCAEYVPKERDSVSPRNCDSYFDPMRGWVTPADDYESETNASLKTVISALKLGQKSDSKLSNDVCDAAEHLLYRYETSVKQGVRERFGKHVGVSWYLLFAEAQERAFVNYQDGPCFVLFKKEKGSANAPFESFPVWSGSYARGGTY